MTKNFHYYITHPKSILNAFLCRTSFLYTQKFLVKTVYWCNMNKRLNLDKPITYNEKLNWLKIYNHKAIYTTMVDKYAVKEYVANIVGSEYIIPTLGVWSRFEDIDFSKLPDSFVLKTTHDGGSLGVVVCKNKATFDKDKARQMLNASLHTNVYQGEWPYKDVPRRIIAEQYMHDTATDELRDYKFFCFDGEVKALFIATDRGREDTEVKFDFYDENFCHLPFKQGHPHQIKPIEKPYNFELMKKLAAQISKGEKHMRVDLYEINGRVYFGEITFFHFGGIVPFEPEEWDYKFGEWLSI